jgi:hypothetical protein
MVYTLGAKSIVVKGRAANSQISDVDQEVVTYQSTVEFVEPTERVAITSFVDGEIERPALIASWRPT